MTKQGFGIAILVVAIAAAATAAYAASALQLYEGRGLTYIKHVNFNSDAGAQTTLLLKNSSCGATNVQIKIGALATDGTNLSQTRTIALGRGETRSVLFNWNKNITDLNFIQLLRTTDRRDGGSAGHRCV